MSTPTNNNWAEAEGKYCRQVRAALAQATGVDLSWRRGRKGKCQTLLELDIAKALWILEQEEWHLRYSEYDRQFKKLGRSGCDAAKARAVHTALRRLRLVPDTTPYDEWPAMEEARVKTVREAMSCHSDCDLTWSKGKTERRRSVSDKDLAVGLWAVECNDGGYLSYSQLQTAFTICQAVGCHRNKAAKLLVALQELGLITKTGKYSAGSHGNAYKLVKSIADVCPENDADLLR